MERLLGFTIVILVMFLMGIATLAGFVDIHKLNERAAKEDIPEENTESEDSKKDI